ncbi:2-thiouracil desulfurase family protein [Paraclostridium bifermentans]|uniref:2-thiouracil desulfurase family protein n=1 Tax=Paraclostridium bifermentans TaxID=1490 RepID=A0ABY8R7E7_PARBF|nr:2-thiouracil desulfurase family protein [Paraclostridium bifermentans]
MRRPKLLISKCLGFENCRYNGQGARNKFIDSLKDYVEFCTVCPEV